MLGLGGIPRGSICSPPQLAAQSQRKASLVGCGLNRRRLGSALSHDVAAGVADPRQNYAAWAGGGAVFLWRRSEAWQMLELQASAPAAQLICRGGPSMVGRR